jgi:hypothetical protein
VHCSKRCRQAEYRERKGLVRGGIWRQARRRRECRLEAELERNLAAVARDGSAPTWADRENARDEASVRASQAWPSPSGETSIEDYVAAQEAVQRVGGAGSPTSDENGPIGGVSSL